MDTPRPAIKRTETGFIVTVPDGDSIVHEALGNVPYKATIEDWVREYFPSAEYAECTAPAIAPPDLTMQGLLVIQAPKGAGKSKAIRAAVGALTPATSVVQVTFRRTLAWSSNEMMGAGASLYSDIAATTISARHHPRLTIVVNSIGRVTGFYDVVVIDEVVSVLDMLSGPLMAPEVKVEAVATLTGLIAHARCVVIADAMLDAACVDFVRKCRQGGALGGSGPDPKLDVMRVLDYTCRLHEDYKYVNHATIATWLRELGKALLTGKRVVVPCMTKSMAIRVAKMFVDKFRVQCYTGDTDPDLLATHMMDIHTHWGGDVVLLVYSPVVTAGCSFEKKHFDVVFFYGFAGLGSVRSAAQMIARVRDVADRRVHVFLDKATTYLPLPSKPLPLSTRVMPSPKKFYMHLLQLLELYRAQEDAQAAHAFPYYFWSLVVHSGAKVGYLREDLQPLVPPSLQTFITEGETSYLDDADLWAELNGLRPDAPMFHDWDAEVARVLPLCERPLQASASMLQRVHQVHPRHWQGVRLVPPLHITSIKPEIVGVGVGVGAGVGTEPWVVPDLHSRIWLTLIAQKSFRRTIMDTKPKPASPLPKTAPAVPTARFFPPRVVVTHGNQRFGAILPDAEVRAKIRTAAAKFAEASTGFYLDAAAAAWDLAAAETAMLTATPMSAQMLATLMLPPNTSVLGLRMSDLINEILMRMTLVLVNYPILVSTTAQTIIDYLCMDRRGAWHIVLCRASGGVDSHLAEDYVKACAMAAVLDLDVHTLTVVYVSEQLRVATVDLPSASADLDPEEEAEVKAAEALRRKRFLKTLTVDCVVPAWDCVHDPEVDWDNVAEWLATAIAKFLGINRTDVNLAEARILGVAEPAEDADTGFDTGSGSDTESDTGSECGGCGGGGCASCVDQDADTEPEYEDAMEDVEEPKRTKKTKKVCKIHDPYAHVKILYEGVLSRGFLVYYWNSRPWGVPIRFLV